jgi:hypothetical protein
VDVDPCQILRRGAHRARARRRDSGTRRDRQVVLGAGERLFCETSDKNPMRLIGTRTLGDGLAYLSYERGRDV